MFKNFRITKKHEKALNKLFKKEHVRKLGKILPAKEFLDNLPLFNLFFELQIYRKLARRLRLRNIKTYEKEIEKMQNHFMKDPPKNLIRFINDFVRDERVINIIHKQRERQND